MTETAQQKGDPGFKAPGATDWRPLIAKDDEQREEARKAQDDLQNALLASLQMQHLVVLAGSGCSIAAGGPSMTKLWDAIIGDEPAPQTQKIATKVKYDLTGKNIEAFLSRIEAFLQIENENAVNKFLTASKKTILDKCTDFQEPNKLGDHQTFLHRLSRRGARAPRLKVFTTNYDLCFEQAAAVQGIVALDGFSFAAPRQYDPRFFSHDIVRRPAGSHDLGQYLEGVFLLHKLHGSVNWARDENDTVFEKDKPKPDEACLIYPAQGKYQQSFSQPYLESIAQYLAAVREPNTCLLVVGFGFNDDHLAAPLLTAIETNPHLRVIVADPCAGANCLASTNQHWERPYELNGHGEDVWFVNATFGGFAQLIPDLKSLTPAENLMKAVKGVTRQA